MTQESPLVICHRCRTPIKREAGTVHGEPYCGECLPVVVVKYYGTPDA